MDLSEQFKNGNIIVVDSVKINEVKTRKIVELLKNLKIEDKRVVFAISNDVEFKTAARNIKNIVVENIKNINAYQVLWANKLVLTLESIDLIKERNL
jgi:large subunit ribosomal protein L4